MTVLVNLGTASTDGTAVTTGNSGGTGSNAFNLVNDDTNTSVNWEADNRWPDSTLGILFTANTSAGQAAFAEWSTALVPSGTTAGQINLGCSIYFTALPGLAGSTTVPLMRALQTGNQRWRVGLQGDGKIRLSGNGEVQHGISTMSLSTGTLYYIEAAGVGHVSAGSIEVRIYSATGTLLETVGPFTSVNNGGPINQVRFGIAASISPSATTSVYLSRMQAGDEGWQGAPVVATPSVAVGPTSGAITSATAKAAWRLEDSAGLDCRMVVSTASDLLTSPSYSSAAPPDADGVFMASVSGLTANTAYYYGVEVDGTILADGRGQLKTFPTEGAAANFAIAFTSCQITNQDSDTWDLIRNYNGSQGPALILAHLGDYGYPDWTTAVGADVVRAHYEQQMLLPKLGAMHAALPWSYVPNNHDWAGGLCDKNSASGPSVSEGYRQFIPSYTLPDADDIGFWHSWTIGRVRFISLDMRSSRDPALDTDNSSKSMLGANQLAWLETELQRSEPLKVIFSDPWRAEGASSGRWGAYTYEFDVVNDMIDLYANGRVIIGSGDRHALGADDGTANNTRGRPNVLGAPANQGSEEFHEVWSDGYFYSYQGTPVEENVDAAGFMEFEDNGSSIIFTFLGKTSDGTTRVTYTQTFDLSVTKGSDLRWNTPAIVTDATDLRYNTASVVTDATDLQWNVPSVITDASDLRWNTPAVITDAASLLWNSYIGVTDAADLRWDALAEVADSTDLLWDTPAVADGAVDLLWNTPAVATDAVELRYNSYAIGTYALDVRYGTYIVMSAVTDLRYDTMATALDHLGLVWSTYELVTDALSVAWDDYVSTANSSDLLWNTPALTEADTDLRYDTAAIVQADDALRWDSYCLVSVDEEILWNVEGFGSVSKALTIRHNTYATIVDGLPVSYHSYSQVVNADVLRWDVLGLVEQSTNLRWSLGGSILAQVDLLWNTEGIEREVITVSQDTGPVTAALGSDGPIIAAAPSTRVG